jgi:prophage antirepressor-like protein
MIDFKKWRKDKRLTQDQAGAILGRSGDLWGYLEADKQPEARVNAYTRVLRAYDNSAERLNKTADSISQGIDVLISKAEEAGLGMKDVAALMGCSTSTVHNLKTGKPTGRAWELSAAALLIEVTDFGWEYAQDPIPALQDKVFESVTIPATETTPECTLTPDDVVIAVAGKIVTEQNPGVFEKVQPVIVDGQPFWVVADVCRAIEHSNPSAAIRLAREGDLQKVRASDSVGREVEQWAVNEFGLLRILAKSNVPKAEPFERWVFEEVLPGIRKTGQYQVVPRQPSLVSALESQLQAARILEEQQQRINELNDRVAKIEEAPLSSPESMKKMISDAQDDSKRTRKHLDLAIKRAAVQFVVRTHGSRENHPDLRTWKSFVSAFATEINGEIKRAVARNWGVAYAQAPSRDLYTEDDKRIALKVISAWRKRHKLEEHVQLTLSL